MRLIYYTLKCYGVMLVIGALIALIMGSAVFVLIYAVGEVPWPHNWVDVVGRFLNAVPSMYFIMIFWAYMFSAQDFERYIEVKFPMDEFFPAVIRYLIGTAIIAASFLALLFAPDDIPLLRWIPLSAFLQDWWSLPTFALAIWACAFASAILKSRFGPGLAPHDKYREPEPYQGAGIMWIADVLLLTKEERERLGPYGAPHDYRNDPDPLSY